MRTRVIRGNTALVGDSYLPVLDATNLLGLRKGFWPSSSRHPGEKLKVKLYTKNGMISLSCNVFIEPQLYEHPEPYLINKLVD